VGILGLLTIRPDFWDKGIAKLLLNRTMDIFEQLETEHIGIFTFSKTSKNIHLYQKYNFWARFLKSIMSRPVRSEQATKDTHGRISSRKYSDVQKEKPREVLGNCYSLTDSIYSGLDLKIEIISVANQKLGETILLIDNKGNNKLVGIAICHCRSKTEAESNMCYIKFGSVISSEDRSKSTNCNDIIDCCEQFAASQGLSNLLAGINTGNIAAYRK